MTRHNTPATGETSHALFGSLVCWLCLLIACAVHAAVALSPKLLAFVLIRNEYEIDQMRLVALDGQKQRMKKIAEALEIDPEFNAAMARADFEQTRPDELRIPVGSHLAIEARPSLLQLKLPDHPLPWYTPVLRLLSEDRPLRTSLWGLAALLAVFSFVMSPAENSANEAGQNGSVLGGWLFHQLRGRYYLPDSFPDSRGVTAGSTPSSEKRHL